jgi:competence protein ComEC
MLRSLLAAGLCLFATSRLLAGAGDGRLDIYFIDVEGGAATLLVTPAGESMLIDSGYPDNGGRDRDRILNVIQNVAKLDHLDHISVSHWHLDHFGNHAALADKIKIRNFWDRGIPDMLQEDNKFGDRIALYRAASQNQSKAVKAGDTFTMSSSGLPVQIKIVTASGDVVPNEGPANPFASLHKPQADDPSDNAKSVSVLFTFGKFRFMTCGDLTWNTEAKLMTPNNPVGQVDLFMVTHHGLNVSNNPVMVLALDPRVTVTCNGPTKGGAPETIATLKKVKSLQAMYQLHRNIKLADNEQAPAEYIANQEDTAACKGTWIKASVAKDGNSYTVQVGADGKPREFQTR